MKKPLDELEKRLKDSGNSITEPRKQLFAALQAHEARTMRQLLEDCPEIDKTTVYRNIELFEQLGVVRRIQIGWKYQLELTDAFVHHHHHFTCTGCGVVTPLAEDAELEARLVAIAAAAEFEATDHQLEIHGLCSHCREPQTQ